MTNPKALKQDDHARVDSAPTSGPNNHPRPGLANMHVVVVDPADHEDDVWVRLPNGGGGAFIQARHLTLIEEPTPKPAPAITDEHHAAVEWLRRTMNIQLEPHAGLLFDLLPSELTNPQPVLPEEHGEYHDATGHLWWLDSGGWHNVNGPHPDAGAQRFAPFTRLVPERPQITREQVVEAVDAGFRAGMPGSVEFSDALHAALVNGADQ